LTCIYFLVELTTVTRNESGKVVEKVLKLDEIKKCIELCEFKEDNWEVVNWWFHIIILNISLKFKLIKVVI